MSSNKSDDVEVKDHVNLVTTAKIYASLYLISKIGVIVSPFWMTIILTSFATIAKGKQEREDFTETVPVEIEIKSIKINGVELTSPYVLPIKPYTTDVHKMVPWSLVNAFDNCKQYISKFTTEMSEIFSDKN